MEYIDYPRKRAFPSKEFCCIYCLELDSKIGGKIKNHQSWCKYRKTMEALGHIDE